jgi:UDP-N-acetylglucosamine 3-dehydrogenase
MKEKFRAAVIGCGAIADRLHVPDYVYCPEAEVVALCDKDKGKAREVADRWAPLAAVYSDYKTMLKAESLDGVTVALPNYLHAPVTVDSLKAGCHVMVEKPMATSMAECRRMVDTANKLDRVLMVNQSQRLFPVHVRAKEVIDSGILGRILTLTAMFGHAGPEYWSPSGRWFFDKKQARFGAMADLGVHKADLVRYLTGKEVAKISAYTALLEKKKATVEDNFVSCVTFTDGTIGTLCASWTLKGMGGNYTILHCEKGSLRVSELPDRPLVAELSNPRGTVVFDVPPGSSHYEGSWGLDVSAAFVRACLGEVKPFCTGEEGMKSLEIIFAAEKSALTGRSVELTHGKR